MLIDTAAHIRSRLLSREGQAMVEYLVVALMLLVLVAFFAILLYALRLQSARVLELVASEYP